MSVLFPELRAWLEPGLVGALSVVDDAGQPEIARVWALRALELPDAIEVHLQHDGARRVVEIVGAGRRAALNLIEVTTYRSRAFKGLCTPAPAVDSAFVEASLHAQNLVFAAVGLPPDAAQRMMRGAGGEAMVALRLVVDAVFDQSPKPGAGTPLA